MADELEFDINKTAAELIAQGLDKVVSLAQGALKGATGKVRLHFQRTYVSYLRDVALRYSTVKTLILRDEPHPLYTFYVPLGLNSSSVDMNKVLLHDLLEAGTPAIIVGGAGSGKSFFMRHLLMESLARAVRIPVFIELRRLNGTELTLFGLLSETIQHHAADLNEDYINAALRAGHFLLLLDGFDEVETAKRSIVATEILGLTSNRYAGTIVVVSSRPDRQVEGWPLFRVFRVKPLDLEDACELIERLPIALEVQEKFVAALRRDIYDSYKEFVSNPLLLSIMLLTFAQGAEIPRKLSLFYVQAYEVLFQQHDALKYAFKRERQSNLDIQQFADVFSAFSLLTYHERKFRFTATEAIEKLQLAQQIVRFQFDANSFLHDAVHAICLLVEDGLEVAFAHRSFQEYFVARFLVHASRAIRLKLLRVYVRTAEQDSVLQLMKEMSPELLERDFFLIELREFFQSIQIDKMVTNHGAFLFLQYIGLSFWVRSGGREFGFEVNASGEYVLALLKACVILYEEDVSLLERERWVKVLRTQGGSAGNSRFKWQVDHMSADNHLVQAVIASDSMFSYKCLEFLFGIMSSITSRYRDQESSLNVLLGLY